MLMTSGDGNSHSIVRVLLKGKVKSEQRFEASKCVTRIEEMVEKAPSMCMAGVLDLFRKQQGGYCVCNHKRKSKWEISQSSSEQWESSDMVHLAVVLRIKKSYRRVLCRRVKWPELQFSIPTLVCVEHTL
jgi:hypothetical protein